MEYSPEVKAYNDALIRKERTIRRRIARNVAFYLLKWLMPELFAPPGVVSTVLIMNLDRAETRRLQEQHFQAYLEGHYQDVCLLDEGQIYRF